MNIDVLGTKYKLIKDAHSLIDADGFCDYTVKEIHLLDLDPEKDSPTSLKDLDAYGRKVLRHELIHAFGFESGLGPHSFLNSEECVDWIALMFPKLLKAFEDAGAMEHTEAIKIGEHDSVNTTVDKILRLTKDSPAAKKYFRRVAECLMVALYDADSKNGGV